MAQSNPAQQGAQEFRPYPVHAAAIALRGVGQVYDLQLSATRVLLRTQARAAAAFGWPDLSHMFEDVDQRARHAFETSAEQLLGTAQRANEAAAELQRQVTRVVETQTTTAAENWQRGLEEFGAQAEEGFTQLCETARQQADEAQKMTHSIAEETRETLRRGGEEMRAQVAQGMQHGRETMEQAAESARAQGEKTAGKASKAAA
jgi:hypothetical protein